jgi:hypothetical protein
MKETLTLRTTFLGLTSWLLPFVVSFLFVDRSGQFLIPQPLFKSLMAVLSGGIGASLLVIAFQRITPSLHTGLALGGYWLLINIVLDLIVLVRLTEMPILAYFYDVGLRYLLIPIIGTAIGMTAQSSQQVRHDLK